MDTKLLTETTTSLRSPISSKMGVDDKVIMNLVKLSKTTTFETGH